MPDEASSSIWETLAQTAPAVFVREAAWAYPALETLHLIGIALVFGSILAYDLRVLGRSADLRLDGLGRHLLPWVWGGFFLNAMSGTALFISDAAEFAANPALVVKLGLILLAGLNALYFQMRVKPFSSTWNENAKAPFHARASALFSILIWIGVVTAGRMMAYVK